jgi:hypothetical protein
MNALIVHMVDSITTTAANAYHLNNACGAFRKVENTNVFVICHI